MLGLKAAERMAVVNYRHGEYNSSAASKWCSDRNWCNLHIVGKLEREPGRHVEIRSDFNGNYAMMATVGLCHTCS